MHMNREQQAHYAERARTVMDQWGWSNARLAKESGVAENTVADFVAGRKQTQPSKVRQILAALGIPESPGDVLVLEGVPEDVRVFATNFVARISALSQADRNTALARLYPELLRWVPPNGNGLELTEEAEDLD